MVGRPLRLWRRGVVVTVVCGQLLLVARGYWSAHKEFAVQMFPESSTWQADVFGVTVDGERVPHFANPYIGTPLATRSENQQRPSGEGL